MQIQIDDASSLAEFIREESLKAGLTPQDVADAILSSAVMAFKRSTRVSELSSAANWQQAYQWYREDRREKNQQVVSFKDFYTSVHTYHQGYMRDISFGELAEAVGVSYVTMDHIVMLLGLWLNL